MPLPAPPHAQRTRPNARAGLFRHYEPPTSRRGAHGKRKRPRADAADAAAGAASGTPASASGASASRAPFEFEQAGPGGLRLGSMRDLRAAPKGHLDPDGEVPQQARFS